MEANRLEGRKAILEAISRDIPIDKLFIKNGEIEGTLKLIAAMARDKGIVITNTSKVKLDAMSQSRNHQGVIAYLPEREYSDISDILNRAKEKGEEPLIVITDGITDTYNQGAIIRSACACGAHGVIIPKKRSATLTGMVAKASSGAVSFIHIARVPNITAAIKELKQNGIWIYCADLKGKNVFETKIEGAAALVIGGEGTGVSRLARENCDFAVGIPMYGEVQSLNASVAAGILMYEIIRQRRSV